MKSLLQSLFLAIYSMSRPIYIQICLQPRIFKICSFERVFATLCLSRRELRFFTSLFQTLFTDLHTCFIVQRTFFLYACKELAEIFNVAFTVFNVQDAFTAPLNLNHINGDYISYEFCPFFCRTLFCHVLAPIWALQSRLRSARWYAIKHERISQNASLYNMQQRWWALQKIYLLVVIIYSTEVPGSGNVCEFATNLSVGVQCPIHTSNSSNRDELKIRQQERWPCFHGL